MIEILKINKQTFLIFLMFHLIKFDSLFESMCGPFSGVYIKLKYITKI